MADGLPVHMSLSRVDVDSLRAANDVEQQLIYIHRPRLEHKLMSSISSENHKSMRASKSADCGTGVAAFRICNPACSARVLSAITRQSVRCDSPALTMTGSRMPSLLER